MLSISVAQAQAAGLCLQQAQLSALLDAVERDKLWRSRGTAGAQLVRVPQAPGDGFLCPLFWPPRRTGRSMPVATRQR